MKYSTICGVLAAAITIGCYPAISSAANTESILENAAKYTVKIVTRVTTPLHGEKKGAFLGAGFLVDKKMGWILTNAHVAGRSPSSIVVAFKGHQKKDVKKVYVDPVMDVAIVRLDPSSIPNNAIPADLECETTPKQGQPIVVFGHPWGFDFTATRGIVSSSTYIGKRNLIQTDASIKEGNSGGPVLDVRNGQVIGIATSIVSANNDANGIGFATPIPSVCKILDMIRLGKDPSPPQLPLAFFEGYEETDPLKVASVFGVGFDSLQTNDEILHVVGTDKTITHEATLSELLRGHYEQPVELMIRRAGVAKKISVTLNPMNAVMNQMGLMVSGITLSPTDIVTAGHLEKRLEVTRVENGSVASLTALEPGDRLRTTDGKSYAFTAILFQYLSSKQGSVVHMVFERPHLNGISSWFEYDFPVKNLTAIAHVEYAEHDK